MAGAEDIEPRWARRSMWAAAGCLLFLTIVGNPAHRGGNTASRLATVESLVHRGTFAIGDSPFLEETHDYVQLDGRTLSTKPPLLSTTAAGVYFVIHHLTGLSIVDDIAVAHRLLIFVVETLPHALLLYFGYLLLGLWFPDPRARGWAFLMLCFGFLGAGYATTLNNHSPAAAAAMAGLYFGARIDAQPSEEPPSARLFAFAGLSLGLLPTLDLPSALISAGVGLPILMKHPRRFFLYFVPAALVPMALHLGVNYVATDSLVPIYLRGDLYSYQDSYWSAPEGMDALDEPKWFYLLHMLFGHHGFFLLSPILAFGFAEALHQVRHRGPRLHLAAVALVSLVGIVTVYLFRSGNYGGACVGLRWLIPVMPLFILLVGSWLDRTKGFSSWALRAAFLVSIVSFVNAAVHPWSHSGVHWLFHQFMDTGALL